MWGSNDPSLQGSFDLSGIPLPPGVTTAGYQITFEAIDPLYILTDSVGPYVAGQVTPSGTLQSVTLPNLSAGSTQTLTVTASGSAVGGYQDAIGAQSAAAPHAASGLWVGRLSQVGQADWFTFPVRGNRIFTIVTQALDETGAPTESKAMPSIGVWDAFDPIGATAVGAAPGLNGLATGETWLRVATDGDDMVRIGIADLRGDGRPDYAYNGWVLYADTVSPARLPASGGPIVIQGMGFRLADTVSGRRPARHSSPASRPIEITAIAPAAAAGVTGSVDVEVDDLPTFYAAAIISGGISYDSGTGDALTLLTAPSGTVPIGVPIPFSVTALGSNLAPAGGVTVIYSVTSGTATLACGLPVCSVTATGDGRATMNVTAANGTWSIVTASLTNGSSLQAQFVGGTPPVLSALTPQLSLAAGATFTWTVQALVLSNGMPSATSPSHGKHPTGGGISPLGSASALTTSSGIASQNAHCRPARRRPNRHHQRLPQRNQPVRRLHRLRCASRIRTPTAHLRRQSISRLLRHAQPDRPSPPRHGRQSHGCRHRHSLPGSLCLDSALRSARSLRARRAPRHANRQRHLRPRWLRHLHPRLHPRRCVQPPRHRRLRQHRRRPHLHRPASLASLAHSTPPMRSLFSVLLFPRSLVPLFPCSLFSYNATSGYALTSPAAPQRKEVPCTSPPLSPAFSVCFIVLLDAFQTIILPRRASGRFRLTRIFYIVTWRPWGFLASRLHNPRKRETAFSFYRPPSLDLSAGGLGGHHGPRLRPHLLLPWAAPLTTPRSPPDFHSDLYVSGTTIFTLGLGDVTPRSAWARDLIILESGTGLGFLAVVMGYFPVLYSAFSRREVSISLLDARAGSPPTAAELMRRHSYEGARTGADSRCLSEWERWSAELLESHISYPLLCYFRSQHNNQSWISALTSMLDTSALLIAGVQGHEARQAQLTFAMARHAMVDLAQIFSLAPVSNAPDRLPPERYEQLYNLLCQSGVNVCRDGHSYERLRTCAPSTRAMPKRWAGYLCMPLPPWIADQPHKDNWLAVASCAPKPRRPTPPLPASNRQPSHPPTSQPSLTVTATSEILFPRSLVSLVP